MAGAARRANGRGRLANRCLARDIHIWHRLTAVLQLLQFSS